jgi:hypothetical protein
VKFDAGKRRKDAGIYIDETVRIADYWGKEGKEICSEKWSILCLNLKRNTPMKEYAFLTQKRGVLFYVCFWN